MQYIRKKSTIVRFISHKYQMSASLFQEKVLGYSHLPDAFLKALANVADRISEDKRTEILAELDHSATRELDILEKGYKIIAEAEKNLRKDVESAEHEQELSNADALLNQSSNPSA